MEINKVNATVGNPISTGSQSKQPAKVSEVKPQETGRKVEKPAHENVNKIGLGKEKDSKKVTETEKAANLPVNEQSMNAAIGHVNNKIKVTNTKCEFSYHDETNRISIKVIDKETEEVIREIPAEETLEMISKMWEIAGLMVDEKR